MLPLEVPWLQGEIIMGRRRFNLVYKATNVVDNKSYVGQTTFTLASRKSGHKTKALKLNKPSPFYNAIREYGWDNFVWEIVCYCKDQEELDIKEDETLELLGRENCYNSSTGGKSSFKISNKHKQIISDNMMGNKNPMYGRKLSQEEKTNLLNASMEVCKKKVIKLSNNQVFESVSECAREDNVSMGTVSLHCNNKIKIPRYQFM